MKYDKEALKRFINSYYKNNNHSLQEIDEQELDIDSFFELTDDVEAEELNENIDDQVFYNELEQLVDSMCDDKEYFVFYFLCMGRSMNDIGKIFNVTGERVRQMYNDLLDKIVDETN